MGNEIATDVHRGMGMTGPTVSSCVKYATGAEPNCDVTKDVTLNVKCNYTYNAIPHNEDVG